MGPIYTSEDESRPILDIDLGHRLSQFSENAKFAATLNQLQRVAIRDSYDNPEDDGATLYVVDVFLQRVQMGLPTSNSSEKERKRKLLNEKDREHSECQVMHRYSDFRALRYKICEAVDITDDRIHPVCCSYCCRVLWLMTYGSFPSRFPNRGVVATYSGWRKFLAHQRKRTLELFLNELLTAAKDQSYRHGKTQCERFVRVSQLLQTFLISSPMLL